MNNLKKNKLKERKKKIMKNTTKNIKKSKKIHYQKRYKRNIENTEKQKKILSRNKQHKNKKSNKKGGKYVYFPEKNVIQFLPYSYKNTIPQTNQIYNQIYNGNQAGGDILPQTCSNFTPNMLNREFNCQQPFWNEKCT